MLDYTLSDGQRQYVRFIPEFYKNLMSPKKLTAEHIRLSTALGWSIELVSWQLSVILFYSKIHRNHSIFAKTQSQVDIMYDF